MQGKAKTNVKTTKCKTGSNWPAKSISQMQSQCQKKKKKREKGKVNCGLAAANAALWYMMTYCDAYKERYFLSFAKNYAKV